MVTDWPAGCEMREGKHARSTEQSTQVAEHAGSAMHAGCWLSPGGRAARMVTDWPAVLNLQQTDAFQRFQAEQTIKEGAAAATAATPAAAA